MKRFAIITKNVGDYRIPVIIEVIIKYCHVYGDFIAESGHLFARSESNALFIEKIDAEKRLAEIINDLLK